MLMNTFAFAAADEKGNSVLIDLVEYCHVWWIPSFKGVQKVCPWTCMSIQYQIA